MINPYKKHIAKRKKRKLWVLLFTFVLLYLAFFLPIVKEKNFFWGSDASNKHFPVREYLYQSIVDEHKFPFWTERVLLGFPLYVDMENAYLNPVNVLLIVIFGAVTSFKILHFGSFLIGSYAYYRLLTKRGYGGTASFAAIIIYYFSYFHLNHLIHYNIIAISLLLPLNIFLVEQFIQKVKKKYIVFQALLVAYGIYWGQPQITLLVLFSVFLYLLIVGDKLKLNLKLKYIFFVIILSVGLSLPQLVPSAGAYLSSNRSLEQNFSEQGSLTPELSLSFVFPYIYSTWPYYYGKSVDVSFSYTELYNYVGIVALTLGFVYILFGKRDRLFWFAYGMMWTFLILGFVRYVPLVNYVSPVLLSYFRYWARSVILFSFGLGILVAKLLGSKRDAKVEFQKKSLLLVLLPVFYLITLHVLNLNDQLVVLVHDSLVNIKTELILKRDIFLWITLPVATLALYYLYFKNKKIRLYLIFGFLFLLILDFRYFGNDPLTYRIKKYNWDIGLHLPKEFQAKRVVEEGSTVLGMRPLLSDFYTPYGYSQFTDRNYNELFLDLNLGKTPRTSFSVDFLREELDLGKLRDYGFSYVRTETSVYRLRDPDSIDFLKNDVEGEYLVKEEGYVKMVVKSEKSQDLFTTLRYNPNWQVWVNGSKVAPKVWDNVFISVPISKGENVIEFRYVPYDIFYGFLFGAALVSATLILLKPSAITRRFRVTNLSKKIF